MIQNVLGLLFANHPQNHLSPAEKKKKTFLYGSFNIVFHSATVF